MTDHEHLKTLTDIRNIMDRSSRFRALSGLSGVSAGIIGLVGAYIAHSWIGDYYDRWNMRGGYDDYDFAGLRGNLIVLGFVVMAAAFLSGFLFTYRKAKQNNLPVWDHTAKKVLVNCAIPFLTGGVFILALIYNNVTQIIAPCCLIFYGLALVNGSKYTLQDVRYLGITEIALGLINMFFLRKGIIFWAIGFGFCHIIYGALMWWKYERKGSLQT
ncbi:hypothetical protein [Chitinophaga jiangningensis]|nr:hypothetical protein [Chitinophaga jiangningensis]